MNKRNEVKQAHAIYRRREALKMEGLAEAVDTLAGHGLWSRRQIMAITGGTEHAVRSTFTKGDHTGGRFNPDTLDLLLELFELQDMNEQNPHLIAYIVDKGTSVRMLSRLSGIPESTIKWLQGKARAEQAAAA